MDDVRSETTVRDLGLDNVAGLRLLPKHRDGVVSNDQGIQSIDLAESVYEHRSDTQLDLRRPRA